MDALNQCSVELLQKSLTFQKRVSIVIVALLTLIVLGQLFWITLFFLMVSEGKSASDQIQKTLGQEGFKSLEQLNAERPLIPKKFD